MTYVLVATGDNGERLYVAHTEGSFTEHAERAMRWHDKQEADSEAKRMSKRFERDINVRGRA